MNRKKLFAFIRKFDPSQPRDAHGRWTPKADDLNLMKQASAALKAAVKKVEDTFTGYADEWAGNLGFKFNSKGDNNGWEGGSAPIDINEFGASVGVEGVFTVVIQKLRLPD